MANAALDNETKDKFLVGDPQFPYCMGCGHTWVNKSLDSAFKKLGKSPRDVNMITDIGCVGLVDKLFENNTIHTTHGRSTAFATGVQIADGVLYDGDTTNVIMIGDGGATIGLLHLVEAAKLNANLTVLLHNNFVYGMTGGQHSGLTPDDFRTSTTMDGNLVPPLQLVEMMKASHAGYLSRKLATDPDLDDAILEAINYPGFALVEIIELCTGYATKWNKMSKDDVHNILEGMNCKQLGVLENNTKRRNYSDLYKDSFPKKTVEHKVKSIDVTAQKKLDKPVSLVVAGTAGEGVQFASQMFLQSAVSNGMNAMQKNDNPVTIGTGFSISELNVSSEEIYYSGIDVPDYILVTSIDGLNKAMNFIKAASKDTLLLIDDSLELPETKAQIIKKPFRANAKNKKLGNIVALGCLLNHFTDITVADFEKIISLAGKNVENTVEALNIGHSLGK